MPEPLHVRFKKLLAHPDFRRNPPLLCWRAGMWALHCLLKMPARPKFRRWNYRLYLPPVWNGGGSTKPYVFRERYEPELLLLEQFLEPGMTFIDGGAHTGVFTFTAAHLVGPAGRVLSFEPGELCFSALEHSVKMNRAGHVQLRKQAIADRAGRARFYHHQDQENAFSLGAVEGVDFDEVEVTTLDDLVRQEKLTRVDFIKLDVEGAEELVLRGGKETLARFRPMILFEVSVDLAPRFNLEPDGACRALREMGYELYEMNSQGSLVEVEKLPDLVGNFLAIPSERATVKEKKRELEYAVH